ncbi:type-F conjugative transfer system pilin assembly protein TrbC [Serratia marcescens]|uniref:type-F conjugative transfer system pilin assembly protein TrbC n=1 Tax=Serratia marcescens TaxID=615 RepID=UPI001EF7F398|nr:type-F conjugative transfer system pilin assembly protein TrbC [Serratia marcescens]
MEKTKLRRALMPVALMLALGAQAEERSRPLDQTPDEVAYFVSFSISEKSLVALLRGAKREKVPVYLRGLVNDDMKATAQAVYRLENKYDVGSVNIDPLRFAHYGIASVPALVRRCGEKFDVVYGNLAVRDGLELINARGECAKTRSTQQPQ